MHNEIPGLIVIDDFLPLPYFTRTHAMTSEYYDWEGPDGQVYKRVSLLRVPGVMEALEKTVGPIELLGMGYRLNYAGEPPNQSIHSDLGWGSHALVLYLNAGPSGTAFWRHIETDTTRITVGQTELLEQIKDDWEDSTKWQIRTEVEMKFNRAIIYDSSLYHSRYPFEAFGNTPENGRLIAVAFFNMKELV